MDEFQKAFNDIVGGSALTLSVAFIAIVIAFIILFINVSKIRKEAEKQSKTQIEMLNRLIFHFNQNQGYNQTKQNIQQTQLERDEPDFSQHFY